MKVTSDNLVADGKKLAKSCIFAQIIVSLLLVLGSAWIYPQDYWIAVTLGALASIVPNGIFAGFSFRYSGARQAHNVTKSMNQGAKLKMILTAIIISVAFIVLSAQPVFLFCAYAIVTMTYWLMMFWSSR